MTEHKTAPGYPWAVPAQEPMRMFDALSYEEQLKMVQDALTEGIENEDAHTVLFRLENPGERLSLSEMKSRLGLDHLSRAGDSLRYSKRH